MEKLELTSSDQKVLAEMEKQRQSIRRLWNIDKQTAHFLYFWIKANRPARILEIGTSNGYSTFWLAKAASFYGGVVETIEVDESRFKLAQQNLQRMENITMHFGLAEKIIPNLSQQYELVFLDAGKIGYVDYIKLLLNNLASTAVVIADNVISHSHSTQDYLKFIQNSEIFETMTLSVGSGLEISLKK